MDLFDSRGAHPMLIGAESKPFDDPNFLFELKLDGERCLAYLDPEKGTELINKRDVRMLPKLPELEPIHRQVAKRCILDGELIVMLDGVPSFSEIRRRSVMSNPFRISLAAEKYPACFTAYDILYLDDQPVTLRPLEERKELLRGTVISETSLLALSRVFDGRGTALYALAEQQNLEGVVAKQKGSLYYPGKRTKDWLKIKNLKDDDFVVCGYIEKQDHLISIVLGQYRGGSLLYKGHATMGVSRGDFSVISRHPRIERPLFESYPETKSGNDRAIWLHPDLVCTVAYMERTESGGLRHPVFKGLRADKIAEECLDPQSC